MRVVVLTVDQHGSQTRPDQVPDALEQLATSVPARLAFQRTAGDEFQGVLDDPAALPPRARAPAPERGLEHRDRHRRDRDPAPRPGARRARAGVRRGSRGRHCRQVQPLAGPRVRTHRGGACPRVGRLAVGGPARTAYGPGLGGRRPGRPGPHLRRGRLAPRDHPVGREPAGRRSRDRRGPPGPRAGDVPDPNRPGGRPMNARYDVELVLTVLAAGTAVTGLATGRAQRLWTVATIALVGLALAIAWFGDDADGVARPPAHGRRGSRRRGRRWPGHHPGLRDRRPGLPGPPGRRGAAGRRLDRRARATCACTSRWSQAGGRGWPSCSRSRASAATPSCAARRTPALPSGSSSARSPACSGPWPVSAWPSCRRSPPDPHPTPPQNERTPRCHRSMPRTMSRSRTP